ncbi:hypothetical protein G5714_019325 [Onychostoma macrolepis]|uniref:Uncharacterized protein n=1 Tax=Onychostoma macrolepis TaxID=369639 RepID=A0A7J6BW40_9TELE|nr:hypothetical protein G5714_019325 [Onychostoma macrolepis]
MARATARLTLDWSAEVQERTSTSRLDERFLAGHKCSAPPSLPFLPELHNELLRSWRNPFSACVFPPSKSNYANVKGLEDSGWRQSQKASVAARAPPPRGRGTRQQPRVRQRQDLRDVIDAKKGNSKP